MAFDGYLLKVNGTIFPPEYIAEKSYVASPDQRLELEAKRDTTGHMHRKTLSHMPSKVEFQTMPLTNKDVRKIAQILDLEPSNLKRNVTIECYHPETDDYETCSCYIANPQYQIDHIDRDAKLVYYSPIRYAFTEN